LASPTLVAPDDKQEEFEALVPYARECMVNSTRKIRRYLSELINAQTKEFLKRKILSMTN